MWCWCRKKAPETLLTCVGRAAAAVSIDRDDTRGCSPASPGASETVGRLIARRFSSSSSSSNWPRRWCCSGEIDAGADELSAAEIGGCGRPAWTRLDAIQRADNEASETLSRLRIPRLCVVSAKVYVRALRYLFARITRPRPLHKSRRGSLQPGTCGRAQSRLAESKQARGSGSSVDARGCFVSARAADGY